MKGKLAMFVSCVLHPTPPLHTLQSLGTGKRGSCLPIWEETPNEGKSFRDLVRKAIYIFVVAFLRAFLSL